jgi:hypothetical protein
MSPCEANAACGQLLWSVMQFFLFSSKKWSESLPDSIEYSDWEFEQVFE